jgi:hypothetical protein
MERLGELAGKNDGRLHNVAPSVANLAVWAAIVNDQLAASVRDDALNIANIESIKHPDTVDMIGNICAWWMLDIHQSATLRGS